MFDKVVFVVMISVGMNTLFHSGALTAMDRKQRAELLRKACPCQKCLDTGILYKQHPFTRKEKNIAEAFLQSAPKLPKDIVGLILEYFLDEKDAYEWINLQDPVVGTFKMPAHTGKSIEHCAYIYRYVDVLGRLELTRQNVMDNKALFESKYIAALAQFFVNPQDEPCTIYSTCERYKIHAQQYPENKKSVRIESNYRLNTRKRVKSYIGHEHTKQAEQKNNRCCTIL